MSVRYRVLVADAIAPDGLAPLRNDPQIELVERPGLTGEALALALRDADAVLVRSATRITRESLAYAERLCVIGRAGVGVDTIDVEAATERGIAVLTAPSGNTISAAELTFAVMLALVRRVAAANRSMRAGEWDRARFTGVELYGKRLGLVGAGRIGSEVARRARAFGMRVSAYDPYLPPERARALDIELAPLHQVLAEADVISVHVPLTEATRGLIRDAEFAMMKPGAFLVNVARGGIVDERALLRALTEGRLAGAALDVYEQEPLPADHPLRRLENVVLTPHLGASTTEAQHQVALEIAEAVRAALREGDLSRAVNAPAIGGEEMRRLRPLLALGDRLGVLASTLTDGPVVAAEVRYAGHTPGASRALAASALMGALSTMLGSARVNFVNALHLARSRGIAVSQVESEPHPDYAEHIEVRLSTGGATSTVAGALLAEGHPRVVRIGAFEIDVVPRGTLVLLRNRDVPGVIGRVGTVVGDAGINIGEYHQARLAAGGEALAVLVVDAALPPEVLSELRRIPSVSDVRQVHLDHAARFLGA